MPARARIGIKDAQPDSANEPGCRTKQGGSVRCFLLILLVALSGCASAEKIPASIPLEVAKPITLTATQIASVRAGVVKSLKVRDLDVVGIGRTRAGRISSGVVVCGYVNSKSARDEHASEKPFHGTFLGLDNASGFIVTGMGGTDEDNAATLDNCRRSGLDLAPS
jgi:hypothetical protein